MVRCSTRRPGLMDAGSVEASASSGAAGRGAGAKSARGAGAGSLPSTARSFEGAAVAVLAVFAGGIVGGAVAIGGVASVGAGAVSAAVDVSVVADGGCSGPVTTESGAESAAVLAMPSRLRVTRVSRMARSASAMAPASLSTNVRWRRRMIRSSWARIRRTFRVGVPRGRNSFRSRTYRPSTPRAARAILTARFISRGVSPKLFSFLFHRMEDLRGPTASASWRRIRRPRIFEVSDRAPRVTTTNPASVPG